MTSAKNNSKSNLPEAIITRVAAIDIGSNAIRMQIFERDDKGAISLMNTLRKPIRLGHDVFHNGRILEESFEAAVETMKEFHRIIAESSVTRTAAVATSAVREASNGPALAERILRETDLEIQVISGAEEARLVITAILDIMPLEGLNALHIEVGGGSVEVSLIEDAKIQFTLTHAIGAVRLMGVLNTLSNSENRFRGLVQEYIGVTHKRLRSSIGKKKIDRFIATGGNIDSIIWLLGRTSWGEIQYENGVPLIAYDTLVNVIERLAVYSFKDRVEQLQIRPDRADVILPSALVYASFADMAKARWIYAPGVGVRNGLAIELFRREEEPHKGQKRRQLISAVKALGEKYEFDRNHAEIVSDYALQLFDALLDVHGLGDRERLLLEVAALLHDIGYFVNISKHHKHSYYLISESDLGALSPRDILIVANVARYHRKSFPKEQHENFGILPQKERETILKLASILRIANALDAEHKTARMPLHIGLNKNKLVIELPPSEDRALVRWALASKGDLFPEVFGYNLEAI